MWMVLDCRCNSKLRKKGGKNNQGVIIPGIKKEKDLNINGLNKVF